MSAKIIVGPCVFENMYLQKKLSHRRSHSLRACLTFSTEQQRNKMLKKACHFNNSQSEYINLPVFALFELYLAYLPQEPTIII